VYEITAKIGEGGMGVVYRARDTRLHREVALKVLPDLFASDPERLARFEREAQTLAGLNHPNIAHVHGLEEASGVRALVMEYVDGEDLRERLERGAIPLDEALAIARQIADALAAAHDRGIVHRDLKPANVKVAADGRVRLLDFGLAKAAEDPAVAQIDAMQSPTMTVRGTAMGMIVGTAAYMAPEQAKGRPVDRRADVWAFGVLLYEMLTGRRAFEGADISELLASVLRDSPPLDRLPPSTPPSIRRLLRRCLEKDPAKRLDSMAAVRLEIDDAQSGEVVAQPNSVPSTSRRTSTLKWVAAAAAFMVLGAALAWIVVRPRSSSEVSGVRVAAGFGTNLSVPPAQNLARSMTISRDGRAIAFVGQQDGSERRALFYRRLDSLNATPLAGTDDATDPFFSPGGEWVGFFAGGKLRKVPVSGGAAVALADVNTPRGAFWGDDDVISFTPVPIVGSKVLRIPAAGGTPVEAGPFVEGHVTQRWPQALPGNTALIYTGHTTVDQFSDACLVVQPLPSGSPRVVECGGYGWRYVASGHVLYVHRGALFAKRFDPASATTSGPAIPIVDNIMTNVASGSADFSATDEGTLVYLPGPDSPAMPIDIIERSGAATRLPIEPQNWHSLSYSPDGRQLAIEAGIRDQSDLWLYDFGRGALTRLTFSDVQDQFPIWTPDGRWIVYASARNGPPNLFARAADGSGEEERLLTSEQVQLPSAIDATRGRLFIIGQTPRTDLDVYTITMRPGPKPALDPGSITKVLSSPANEAFAVLSPDGQWIAYVSDESGQPQVYVRPSTGDGGRWQISTAGGSWPTFSRKGELLYCTQGGELMSVKYESAAGSFRADRPGRWMAPRLEVRSLAYPYTLHPDGAKIAGTIQSALDDRRVRSFVMVTKFFDQLSTASAR
jgi:serine/threonine-protein kinase